MLTPDTVMSLLAALEAVNEAIAKTLADDDAPMTAPDGDAPKSKPEPAANGLLAELLSEDQVAAELQRTVRTLALWRTSGVGPPFTRVGRKVFYSKSGFRAWLAAKEINPPRNRRLPT